MIKLLLSLILIASSTLVGNSFSVKLKTRRKTLSSIVSALIRLKTLLCFGSLETVRLLEECFCSEDFKLIKKDNIYESDCSFESAEKWVGEISRSFSLLASDKELLRDFIKGLGSTDVSGQVAHTELYINLFTERFQDSKIKESNKSGLYRVMGFSLGSAISLLMA